MCSTAHGQADETEQQLGIDTCWTTDNPRYIQALSVINNHAFIHVVEHLEGLVVHRLFELSKANLASTGEFEKLLSIDCKLIHSQATRCGNTSPKPL